MLNKTDKLNSLGLMPKTRDTPTTSPHGRSRYTDDRWRIQMARCPTPLLPHSNKTQLHCCHIATRHKFIFNSANRQQKPEQQQPSTSGANTIANDNKTQKQTETNKKIHSNSAPLKNQNKMTKSQENLYSTKAKSETPRKEQQSKTKQATNPTNIAIQKFIKN